MAMPAVSSWMNAVRPPSRAPSRVVSTPITDAVVPSTWARAAAMETVAGVGDGVAVACGDAVGVGVGSALGMTVGVGVGGGVVVGDGVEVGWSVGVGVGVDVGAAVGSGVG